MRVPIIDAHVHMDVRSANDYEAMAIAGVQAVVVPTTFTGLKKKSRAEYEGYYTRIIDFERRRAEAFGIRLYAAVGVDPEDIHDESAARDTLDALPEYRHNENVCALGEVGLERFTDIEIECFRAQLRISRDISMPVIMHTPHQDKPRDLPRMLAIIRDAIREDHIDPGLLLLDDLTADTIELARTIPFGGYGISVSTVANAPFMLHRKAGPSEVLTLLQANHAEKLILSTALAWGYGDPLAIPRVLLKLATSGVDENTLRKLAYENAVRFFSQCGHFNI